MQGFALVDANSAHCAIRDSHRDTKKAVRVILVGFRPCLSMPVGDSLQNSVHKAVLSRLKDAVAKRDNMYQDAIIN